jgi:hypothetical protein
MVKGWNDHSEGTLIARSAFDFFFLRGKDCPLLNFKRRH